MLRVCGLWLIGAACLVADVPQHHAQAAAAAPTLRRFGGMQQSSHYVTMRDGVRLAVDVHVPKGLAAGERTATIVHLSRYYRSLDIKTLWRPFFGPGFYTVTERDTREHMVKAGYSWVDVDVRGTGASFGRWVRPLSPEEVRDGADVMDWIVKQPWSAGVIGVTGGSYSASLAVMQLANEHPALKAVVTRFGAWDMYDDVFLPGGLPAVSFRTGYSNLLEAFDRNRLGDVFGWAAGGMVRGVRPVERRLLDRAQAERASNTNVDRLLAPIVFRDDPLWPGEPWTMDDFSPHRVVGSRSRVPVMTLSGWYDGAMIRGQVQQFLDTRAPGSRLRIGPWFHASFSNDGPYGDGRDWSGSPDEMRRFFDEHLRGADAGMTREPAVHYYTIGREQWRASDTWPPPGVEWQTLYFSASRLLTKDAPVAAEGVDRYEVDPAIDSGAARWGVAVGTDKSRKYNDDRRQRSARLLAYTSAPLASATEVTGQPRVELYLEATASAGAVFVYLEDVAPDGYVRYVTEAQLSLAHRRRPRTYTKEHAVPLQPDMVDLVSLDLLPVSYQFPQGHSIRVSIAGADAGTFDVPSTKSLTYALHRGLLTASRITLPTYATVP